MPRRTALQFTTVSTYPRAPPPDPTSHAQEDLCGKKWRVSRERAWHAIGNIRIFTAQAFSKPAIFSAVGSYAMPSRARTLIRLTESLPFVPTFLRAKQWRRQNALRRARKKGKGLMHFNWSSIGAKFEVRLVAQSIKGPFWIVSISKNAHNSLKYRGENPHGSVVSKGHTWSAKEC